MSANVTSEVQGGNQANQDPHLDDSSCESDASCASSVEDESSHGSGESNLTDAENHELDDGDVDPQELAVRHDMLALFAAAVATVQLNAKREMSEIGSSSISLPGTIHSMLPYLQICIMTALLYVTWCVVHCGK